MFLLNTPRLDLLPHRHATAKNFVAAVQKCPKAANFLSSPLFDKRYAKYTYRLLSEIAGYNSVCIRALIY